MRATYIGCIGTHAHGHEVTSLLCLKWQARKIIYYSCEGRIEKSVPRNHRLSSLGKPRDAKRRSSGQIFLSYPHTHDRFLDSIPK